jgi:Ala-tRNA(Pro) deacylase
MQTTIFDILENLSIPFERVHHPAVYTSEQARRLVPKNPAKAPKNLFLRDKKGRNFFLLAVEEHKTVRFDDLEKQTGLKRLSLASENSLQRILGITPGAVSLLALINDTQGQVTVLIDRELWQGNRIQAHPLVNTETLILSIKDMEKFIAFSGHAIQFVDVA